MKPQGLPYSIQRIFARLAASQWTLSVFVWLGGLGLTLCLWQFFQMQCRKADAAHFAELSEEVVESIRHRLTSHEKVLTGLKGLFAASKSVERGEFRAYVQTLRLADNPGAMGFGFVRYVRPGGLDNFLHATQADEAPDYAYHGPATSTDMMLVEYIEPFAPNAFLRGLDLGGQPIQRAAATSAVDEDRVTLTAPLRSTLEGVQRTGFLLFLPIYQNGAAITSRQERWQALLGWVYTPLLMEDLVADIIRDHAQRYDLEIFDGDIPNSANVLFDLDHDLAGITAGPAEVLPLSSRDRDQSREYKALFGGRHWWLSMSALPGFYEKSDHRLPWLILGGGLIITFFVGHAARSNQRARHKAVILAEEMTLELREEIEQRKSIDEALRSVSRFQEAILRSASYAVISTTPEGVIRVFNPAAQRLLGYSEGEVNSRQSLTLLHDPAELAARATVLSAELGTTVAPGFDTLVARCRRNQPDEHEWTYVCKNGTRLPALVSVSALRDQTGAFTGFLAIAQDVSERKQVLEQLVASRHIAENALREVELQQDALNQHAIVSIAGMDGSIQYVNDKMCEISGYSREELIGQDHRVLSARHHPGEFWRQFWQTIRSGRVWHGEICSRNKLGATYWVDATIVPFRDPAGRVTRYVAIRTDITDRKRQAAALEQAKKEADAANISKSEFLAVMSHEIRTPMNAVLGFADLLNETRLDRQQREFISTIQSSGKGLLDLIDYSKVEAGKLEVERIDFDAREAVETVVRTLSLQAEAKHLFLTVQWPPRLSRWVTADPGRVRQILLNLIGNALKFTARGGITIQVGPEALAGHAGLKFSVIDTGPGIPADQQERLFQKFVQVDASYTREAGGTGLGLAISKRLVELMGGQVGFTSREGLGSTFWFTLPQAVRVSPGPQPELPPMAPAPLVETARSHEALRVLVVDDNPVNVQLAVAFLDKIGCRSSVATDGHDAFGRVKEEKFDLVLMDCQMPGMDGFQATMSIRAWEEGQGSAERLPIIAVTANAQEARSRCFESGMNSFISKPFTLADLKTTIDSVLGETPPPPVSAPDPIPDPTPVTAPSVTTGAAMDHAQALLLADNNPGLLGMLAGAFLAQHETVLLAIRTAITQRDSPALRDQAHKLKGSVAIFAADGVRAAALALEKHATPADWPALELLVGQLEAEMNRLVPEISALELAPAGAAP